MTDTRQDRGVGDLVAVQVENRQHRAVADRIEELVRVPGGGERSGLGFAVTNHARDNHLGIVEGHSVGVRKAVTQLTSFVNRARRFRRRVAADVAGEGEVLEELLHALGVLAFIRVHLGVRALEIRGAEHTRRAVPRAGHEDHIEILAHDHPVHVHPHERQRWARSPVPKQPALDMFDPQRFSEERVVLQINHPDRQVVARAPICVERAQLLGRQRGRRVQLRWILRFERVCHSRPCSLIRM